MFDLHKKYEKVHRFEKDECNGILNGRVYITEKIDGANASIWQDNLGNLCVGSRNRQLNKGTEIFDDFRGLVNYVLNHVGIYAFIGKYPNLRLYGEWLIKHTLNYSTIHYNKFYVFDVFNQETETYLTYDEWHPLVSEFKDIKIIEPFAVLNNPTIEEVMSYLGQSNYIEQGEGIVLKNYDFVNTWGINCYGKIVCADFKEMNKLVFSGHKTDPVENKITSEYVTEARVRKIAIKHELTQMSDIPRLNSLVMYDIITEEMWDIIKRYKKPIVDFKLLEKVFLMATKNHYIEFLNNLSA